MEMCNLFENKPMPICNSCRRCLCDNRYENHRISYTELIMLRVQDGNPICRDLFNELIKKIDMCSYLLFESANKLIQEIKKIIYHVSKKNNETKLEVLHAASKLKEPMNIADSEEITSLLAKLKFYEIPCAMSVSNIHLSYQQNILKCIPGLMSESKIEEISEAEYMLSIIKDENLHVFDKYICNLEADLKGAEDEILEQAVKVIDERLPKEISLNEFFVEERLSPSCNQEPSEDLGANVTTIDKKGLTDLKKDFTDLKEQIEFRLLSLKDCGYIDSDVYTSILALQNLSSSNGFGLMLNQIKEDIEKIELYNTDYIIKILSNETMMKFQEDKEAFQACIMWLKEFSSTSYEEFKMTKDTKLCFYCNLYSDRMIYSDSRIYTDGNGEVESIGHIGD